MAQPDRVRWRTTRTTVDIDGHALDLALLDGFEANVAHDAQRRRGRPDRRPGADISPMFGVLWPGARTLAARLAALDDPSGTSLLELGCGLALPSLIAARRGIRTVATDVHPDAAPLLQRNAEHNRAPVQWARWDWRDPPPPEVSGPFDRVLASDVLYDGSLADPLAHAFERTLAAGGTGWLTDPGRPWLDDFVRAARARAFTVEESLAEHGDDVVVHLTLTR